MNSMMIASPEQDRVLPMAGIHNFRDYGGYAARGVSGPRLPAKQQPSSPKKFCPDMREKQAA